jgi:zinc protease
MQDLDNASLDDVKDWFRTHYGPNNAVLVLAGDIDAATARDRWSTSTSATSRRDPRCTGGAPGCRRWRTNVYDTMQDRVPQTRIYRSWPAPGTTDPQTQALDLAAAALGSGKNSRLYKALVYDAQLASSVSVSMNELEIAGMFDIEVTLNPGADLDQTLEILDAHDRRVPGRGADQR